MPSEAILALAAIGTRRKARPPANQGVGLLLMDSSLNPISCNDETIRILSYPEAPQHIRRLDVFLKDTIQARLLNPRSTQHSHFVTEFVSGKRRYRCWAFHLNRHLRGSSHPALELLLERSASGLFFLPRIAQQFKFSRREQQAVELLLQGLSNKEIANRMNISPNTVNTFFPVGHDQDGGLQPFRDTRKNYQSQLLERLHLIFAVHPTLVSEGRRSCR